MAVLRKENWNESYRRDMISGKGFLITEPGIVKKKKTSNGIFSQKFATDWEDDFSFSERYTCECKEMRGKLFEGEICSICRTKVKFTDVDMDTTGWIKIDKGFIIQPTIYKQLEFLIGDETLEDILNERKDITVTSNSKKTQNPYSRIGMLQFKENYDEIIKYFYKKKKKEKKEIYEELQRSKDAVFTNVIPVFSSVIRPIRIKNEEFMFATINKTYNVIYSLSNKINSLINIKRKNPIKANIELVILLSKLQIRVNELWEFIFQQINSKEGHIKSEILGGRVNFTARNVIVPDPSLKADEIVLCYRTMMELYKFEIISYIVKLYDITEMEAFGHWHWAVIHFNEKIYELIQYFIKKHKPKIIINRPPTINFGSILCMKIKDVNRSIGDNYTMHLPIRILPVLNADFDGDNLTIIALKIQELAKEYDRVNNPRKSMYISRNDGLFNSDFNLFKDQIIGLYEFNNI